MSVHCRWPTFVCLFPESRSTSPFVIYLSLPFCILICVPPNYHRQKHAGKHICTVFGVPGFFLELTTREELTTLSPLTRTGLDADKELRG